MSNDSRLDSFLKYLYIYQMAKETGRIGEPRIQNVFKVIRAFSHDPNIINVKIKEAEKLLVWDSVRAKLNTNPFGQLPELSDINGPFNVGRIIGNNNLYLGLNKSQLNQNMLIVGRAGAGKTTAILGIVSKLIEQGMNCWLIDFKQDYRCLLNHFSAVTVITWQNLKFNILEVPANVDPLNWLQIVTDVFTQSFGVSSSSKYLLVDCLDQLYKERGIFEGSEDYPTMIDLDKMLRKRLNNKSTSASDKGKIYTCLNKTTALVKRLGTVLDCSKGFPINELLNHTVVFELNGLSTELESTEFLRQY